MAIYPIIDGQTLKETYESPPLRNTTADSQLDGPSTLESEFDDKLSLSKFSSETNDSLPSSKPSSDSYMPELLAQTGKPAP